MGYLLTEAGVTVNGQTAGILPVLVFGAGTDYALLLVARYREELRKHEDKHEAMALALRRAGPAIVASGLTVIAALLTLTLAQVNGTAGLGPVSAAGILLALISMLTLLPALLTICGRRAFWPFIPRYGSEAADETHGFWRRLGNRIDSSPRRVWLGMGALLIVLALGLTQLDTGLTSGNGFRDDVDSVAARSCSSEAFPGGTTAPTDVVVTDPSKTRAVRRGDRPGAGRDGRRPHRGGRARRALQRHARRRSRTQHRVLRPRARPARRGALGRRRRRARRRRRPRRSTTCARPPRATTS